MTIKRFNVKNLNENNILTVITNFLFLQLFSIQFINRFQFNFPLEQLF